MKNTSSKSKTKAQFVVLRGDFDDSPEDVEVAGIFPTLKAAQKFVKDEYLADSRDEYADDEEETADDCPEFKDFLEGGHMFWRISKV